MSNIVINMMQFSNILSYGPDNTIRFVDNSVTQLVGKNGAGKSSIATILEEGLYNKNSRGIKKEALFNWTSSAKHYSIFIDFNKDSDHYIVQKEVKSTAKVTLFKNGENISGHTATQTYKLIEEIIGCDFSTFTKLVYQSIGSSLDFLKTTDANRKAFLTTLFSQEQYKEISEEIKKDAKLVKTKLDTLNGKLSGIEQVIARASKASTTILEKIEVPELDEQQYQDTISEAKVAAALAKDVEAKTLKYKSLDKSVQAAKKTFELFEKQPTPVDVSKEYSETNKQLAVVTAEADKVKKRYQSFKKQAEVCDCPTCGRPMDVSESVSAAEIAKQEYTPLFENRTKLETKLQDLKEQNKEYNNFKTAFDKLELSETALQSFIVDNANTNFNIDYQSIIESNKQIIDTLTKKISEERSKVALAVEHNNQVDILNARTETLKNQLDKALEDIDKVQVEIDKVSSELNDLEILAVAFKELVAYKLEHCVKTFEELINNYLGVITSGKFALGFELDATKLVVVIYNDGVKTSMESCSTGQQHRIQLATLLAIRSLMSAISKVNINVLFLDEVISFIDTQGINTLVELLCTEHELNSFLVSHGHTHPMAKVISVEQDPEGYSRLSNG